MTCVAFVSELYFESLAGRCALRLTWLHPKATQRGSEGIEVLSFHKFGAGNVAWTEAAGAQ